jgi:hypothetical protein
MWSVVVGPQEAMESLVSGLGLGELLATLSRAEVTADLVPGKEMSKACLAKHNLLR